MSLNVTLSNPKEIVVQPAVTRLVTELVVERVVDLPREKRVVAHVEGFGRFDLETLSDNNYNNPPWTDELVIDAIKAKLGLN